MKGPQGWILSIAHVSHLKTVKAALLLAAGIALASVADAATIGPWPATQPYLWLTNWPPPVCGTVAVVAPDVLQMSGFASGSKSTWLPYSLINASYSERMCLAQLWFNTNSPVTNVHAKVYDPVKSGKSGWAIILLDSSGRIFDFGIRGCFAPAAIIPHQYDGSSWVNYGGGTQTWTPRYDRTRYQDDYYTMDFTNNSDGTISWAFSLDSHTTNVFSGYTGTSVVTYTNINLIYLNVMTSDTTGAGNYKWTQFSVTPQVYSPPTLTITPASSNVLLSWQSAFTTNFLRQTAVDVSPANWTTVTNEPVDDGTQMTVMTVTLPAGSGNQFFQLKK